MNTEALARGLVLTPLVLLVAALSAADGGVTLRGRVVDEAGDAICRPRVEAFAVADGDRNTEVLLDGENSEPLASDIGDDWGGFELSGLEPGVYDLIGRSHQYLPTVLRVEVPEASGDLLELVLTSGACVSGRVANEAGEPVDGAEVGLLPTPARSSRNHKTPRFRPSRRGAASATSAGSQFVGRSYLPRDEPPPAVRSDRDGRFLLRDIELKTYRLTVAKTGYAESSLPGYEVTRDPRQPTTCMSTGDIVLPPAVAIEGVVVDLDDQPLDGADVKCRRSAGITERDRNTRTDGRGHFIFDDLRRGESCHLEVKRNGYLRASLQRVLAPTVEPIEMALRREAVLRGRVLDAHSDPVAGLGLLASLDPESKILMTYAMTDEDGEFEMPQIPEGTIRLQLNQAHWILVESPLIEVQEGEVIEGIDLTVTRGGEITGLLRDATGEPIAGARVSASRKNGSSWSLGGSTSTDDAGRFSIRGLHGGSYRLRGGNAQMGRAEQLVDLAEEHRAYVELWIEGDREIGGRVFWTDGKPADGANIRLLDLTRRDQPQRESTTDAEGRFHWRYLMDGEYRILAGYSDLGTKASQKVKLPDVAGTELRLELPPGAVITGRLIGLEPQDLAVARVSAYPPGRNSRLAGRVRHDGSYRVESLGAGRWKIVVTVADDQRTADVEIEEGQLEANLDLDFSSGSALNGRILIGGEPADGARVRLTGPSNDVFSTQADHVGEFWLDGLPEGWYRVQISHRQQQTQHVETLKIPHSHRYNVTLARAPTNESP